MKIGIQTGNLIPAQNLSLVANPDRWAGVRFYGITIGQTFIGIMRREARKQYETDTRYFSPINLKEMR